MSEIRVLVVVSFAIWYLFMVYGGELREAKR